MEKNEHNFETIYWDTDAFQSPLLLIIILSVVVISSIHPVPPSLCFDFPVQFFIHYFLFQSIGDCCSFVFYYCSYSTFFISVCLFYWWYFFLSCSSSSFLLCIFLYGVNSLLSSVSVSRFPSLMSFCLSVCCSEIDYFLHSSVLFCVQNFFSFL